jgi:arylsulfatase A-like enzyme
MRETLNIKLPNILGKKKRFIVPFLSAFGLILILFFNFYQRSAQKPDILLISIDAFPKYSLGAYGYPRNITPHIDTLAEHSFIFEDHIANATWTFPSMASVMTSAYPSELGIKNVLGEKLTSDIVTLAEILQQNDYYTAAAVAALSLSKQFGLDQGFDEYHVLPTHSRALEMTEKAITIFTNRLAGKPIFLWLHYFDPHCPYKAPQPYTNKYVNNYTGTIPADCSTAWRKTDDYIQMNMTPTDGQYLKDRQDGEIEYTDREVGRLFRHLKEIKQFHSSLIIITADHGEEFFEHKHGFIGHGIDFYDTVINVPFIVKFPRQNYQKRIKYQTRHIDVLPTLLDVLNISGNNLFSGTSLLPLVKGKAVNLPAYSEYNAEQNFYALRYNHYKFIYRGKSLGEQGRRLFNLEADPKELVNLAKQNSTLAQQMHDYLKNVQTELRKGSKTQTIHVPEKIIEQLRELGYIQ